MNDRPSVVYKYCDPRGVDIFTNLRLRVTPPNRFNDFFEFAPRMKPTLASGSFEVGGGNGDELVGVHVADADVLGIAGEDLEAGS